MVFLPFKHGKDRLAVSVSIYSKILGSQESRYPIRIFFQQVQ